LAIVSTYDEQELLNLLRLGDPEAFTQLYKRHSERVFYNLLRLVKSREMALEILQDIFVKIWDRREKMDIQQNFGSYISRIGENLVIDFYRKAAREKKLFQQLKAVATEEFTETEELTTDAKNVLLLKKAIEHLPPQRKKVFELCKIEGKSYSEISHELGISTSTINDHVVKATRRIRMFMHNHHPTAICLLALITLRN
jgi:RNA polymerase sigma-70 factor (ECF subfamily)